LAAAPTVTGFRDDPLYPRIQRAVSAVLAEGKVVTPVDVLVRMQLLAPADLEAWRMGRVPYLEKVIAGNLTRLGRLLRILRMHAHELNLVPSTTVYMRWGKGPKRRLRFSKTGEQPIEDAYSRHFVWPGKMPFHPPRPRIDMSEHVKNKHKKPVDPVGIAWYRPEQWALLREVSTDRDKISEIWSEWEATASQKLAELRELGLDIRKVDVDVDELRAWCEQRQRSVDAGARSEYVAEKLRRERAG
jgi:hypothetical protein